VDDNSTADNALWTDQLNKLVLDRALAIALSIGLEVAKVTNVTDLVGRGTVCLAMGVEMRPRRCATVCVVTELVDVHATLSIGIVAGDVP